jgi:hypothetical protein
MTKSACVTQEYCEQAKILSRNIVVEMIWKDEIEDREAHVK